MRLAVLLLANNQIRIIMKMNLKYFGMVNLLNQKEEWCYSKKMIDL